MKKVHVAKWYDLLLYPDWLRRLHQKPKKFLCELVMPGMIVADIGCGLGFYSLELAMMVGTEGRVLAVDFQSQMLDRTAKKAKKAAILDRIKFIQCTQKDLKISESLDFILSMWMAHEVPDRGRLFRQICSVLKPNGRYLLVEPKFHVRAYLYKRICGEAEKVGLKKISEPKIAASYAALFEAAD